MKRFLLILLCACLLLTGCNGNAPEATDSTPTADTTAATDPTTEPTEDATTAPALQYSHPLTGEPIAKPLTTRPAAVIINNISAAQPLHGIGGADFLFEHVAEGGGGITRMLGIFTDLKSAGKIGSIRSARTYMIELARSLNAPLVHCGGSNFAYSEFSSSKWNHLDEIYNGSYFFRDKDRTAAGYSKEHTLFAQGEKLMEGLLAKGFDMEIEDGVDFGLLFSEKVQLNGEAASEISIRFYSKSGKRTILTYNAEEDVYYGVQKWSSKTASIADANNKKDVPFRNVLILNAKTTTNGYRMFSELTGEGTGHFACGGKYIPIKWSRKDTTSPFVYTTESGAPITLGIGKTYVAIRPNQSPAAEFK